MMVEQLRKFNLTETLPNASSELVFWDLWCQFSCIYN